MKTKVLIAEDDKFITRALEDGLKRVGFTIEKAGDGQEALEKIESTKPDVILLDLIMPKVDGFEVLEKINQKEEWKKIPILVFSNLETPEDIKRAKKLGGREYLLKANFTVADIIKKIEGYCER